MNNEIKEILDKLECDKDDVYYVGYTDGVNIDNTLMPKDIKLLLDYITNLQEKSEKLLKKSYSDDVRITKAIEYGKNCLENLKDQEDYMCESIDIVGLLRMIHKNYIGILQGEDK